MTKNTGKLPAETKAPEETKTKEAAKPSEAPVKKAEQYKCPPMSEPHKEVLKDLDGTYTYIGPTLNFMCHAKKECALIKGRDYEISELPKHELIANAILRGFLVKKNDANKEA